MFTRQDITTTVHAWTSNCATVPSHGWQYLRKNRMLNRTSNGGSYPQSVPRSLAWGGGGSDNVTGSDIAARPEVNKNTLYWGQNHVFCLMTYLQSGRVRHPSDVTPMSLIHEHNKRCLPLGWAGHERVTRPWNVVIKARQEHGLIRQWSMT